MEGNSFSNNLRDHSVGSKPIKDNSSNSNSYKQLKDSWSSRSNNNQGSGEDYLAGFSWPPRSYTCSFCKREFRSAQALGGHMNVHRRDRARLRQSPPRDHGPPSFLNLNFKPNPNPNFPSISSPSSYTLPSLVSPPLCYSSNYSPPLSLPSSAFPTEMKKWRVNSSVIDPLSSNASGSTAMKAKSLFGAKDYGCNKFIKKTTEYVKLDLDLEIGLVSDSKEDLDLELRLGYS